MRVDIIIPTYSRYEILHQTLESVKAQSYPHWVCWIAEDGQSQETYAVVKPFLSDDRFTYLPGEHSGSPAKPRNRAIVEGNSELIAFLDDDDVWLPEKLEKQVHFFQRTPGCIMFGCNAYRWSGTSPWDKTLPLYFQKDKFFGKIPYSAFVKENHVIISSVMIKREALSKSGLFNESLPHIAVMAEDYEFWLRIGALGEIWNLATPCLLYRETPPTYYEELDREQKYKSREIILTSALEGTSSTPSPLSLPENQHHAAACRNERDFYRAGPRFLGRLRHEMKSKIKNLTSSSS
jgi:glycosyltransferase involved in cell wall biosynthesis